MYDLTFTIHAQGTTTPLTLAIDQAVVAGWTGRDPVARDKHIAELEAIVDQLEKGSVALEDSIKLYERGEALKSHCDALLKNAEMRIEKITLTAEGKPKGLAPLDDA